MHKKQLCLAGLFLISALSSALAGTTGNYPAYSGQKKMAIILINWKDTNCPTTRQTIVDRMWNNSNSVRHYYRDMSRNVLDFIPPADAAPNGTVPASTTAVYGPYTLSIAAGFDKDVTFANADDLYGGNTMPNVKSVAASLAAARDGYNASNYNYVMYVTPKCDTTGGIGGYADYGSNYSHMFDVRQNYLNHEIGHDFKLSHSNTTFDVDGYNSQDCVMGNASNSHLDGPHSYQVGWYPDACYPVRSYGQYDIENLAQPNTDNAKVLRFDRGIHGATSNPTYNLWVEYRVKGIGQDSGLNTSWDKMVNIHMCKAMSNRPTDAYYATGVPNNNVSKFAVGGSYTEPNNKCKVQFLRSTSTHATVQLINPSGNQPPSIPANQVVTVSNVNKTFTLSVNDPENGSLQFTVVQQPLSGAIAASGNTLTYTGSVYGIYSFTVRVNDGQYDSYDQTVTLQYASPNPPAVDAGEPQAVSLTGGQTPWTPAMLTTEAWYDAATITASSGSISQWLDRSGNERHMVQNTAADQPTTGGNINGVNALVSDITDYFSRAAFGSGTYDVFYVGKGDNGSNASDIALAGSSNNSYLGLGSSGSTKTNIMRINGVDDPAGAKSLFNGESTQSVSTRNNIHSKVGLSPFIARFKNVPVMTGTIGIIQSPAADSFEFVGLTGEVIFISSHTAEEAVMIEGYLAHKWGLAANLPNGHLYKNAAPTTDGTSVVLQGNVTDVDGDTPTTIWTKVSGPGGVLFGDASAIDTTAYFTTAGTYTLRLAADDGGNVASDEVVITVSNPTSTVYASWAGNTFANPFTNTAMGSDADGDGKSNMLEFAFGTDPTLASGGVLAMDGSRHGDPIPHMNGGGAFELVFLRRKAGSAGSLTYTAEFSSNLQSFGLSGPTPIWVANSTVNPDYEIVKVPYPAGAIFGRVRVVDSP